MELNLSRKFNSNQKQAFFLELHLLLSSGLDLKSTLDLIVFESDKNTKSIAEKLRALIIEGHPFYKAMEITEKFAAFEINSIQIGEETSNLPVVTASIAQYYKDKQKLRKQFIGALTYPLVVIVVAFGVLYFMLTNVVPMFANIFTRFDKELPPTTKFILNLSQWLSGNQLNLFLVILTLIGVYLFLRRKSFFRIRRDYFLLRFPFFGSVILKYHLANFARSMQILLLSKVSINRALELSSGMLNFEPVKQSVLALVPRIIDGKSLQESMKDESVFNGKVKTLISVGESVNKLDEAFAQLSEQLNAEIDHLTKQLNTLLEPFLISIVALVVGFILISMYMPLFSLSTAL